MTARLVAAIASVLLILQGCVVLPVPIPASGTRVGQEAAKLVVGVTARDEVRAQFGAPNGLATERDDLWLLERDPAHMTWLILFGGPGYASGGAFRTGEPVGYVLHVIYDPAGRVAHWQWRAADGYGQTSEAPAPTSPFLPVRRLEWQAVQAVEADEAALIVTVDEPRRLIVERIALDDGRRLGRWTGDPAGCRVAVALAPGNAMSFGLVDGTLVSVPPAMTPDAVPCRWERHADGTMVATRLPGFAASERTVAARLAGDRVVRQDRVTGLAVLSLAGETLVRDATAAGWLEAVAAAADADRLLVRHLRPTRLLPDFRLIEPAAERVVALPALADLASAGGCSFSMLGRVALSPDGRTAALGCTGHVQVWTLGEGAAPPVLARLLPVPPGVAAERLAFSRDGGRLVLGAAGIMVWRTADWSLEALLPGVAAGVAAGSPAIVPTPDGSGLSTAGGYWQLAPPSAETAG